MDYSGERKMDNSFTKIYTPKEAAKILKCEETTVKGLMNRHKITYIKVGKFRRIKENDLQEFINNLKKTEKIK
jgi:excisionase family DNA binding protein